MKRLLKILLLCLVLCTTAFAAHTTSPGRLTDGVWYGTAAGRGGAVTVSLRVRSGRIAEAQASGPQETPGIFAKALALLDQMIGMDSVEALYTLDAISGATLSSQGILNAAEMAMEKATPDTLPGWLHAADGRCPGSGFADLPVYGNWAHRTIDWALCAGITKGVSETSFAPEQVCTRGQVVTFLWRAAGQPSAEGSVDGVSFTDVDPDAYYYEAVCWAVEKGVTKGTSELTFSPDAACTRGQVVTFLWRAAGQPSAERSRIKDQGSGEGVAFTDVDPDAYYYDAVHWAVKNEITNGVGETLFAPGNDCTRAQVVTFCFRSAFEIVSN